MTHNLDIRTDAPAAEWDAFVSRCPGATFYHRSGWQTVARHAFGHRGHYLSAYRGTRIVGIFPLIEVRSLLFGARLVSTGMCVGGGPVAEDDGSMRALIDKSESLAKALRVKYVEVRDCRDLPDDWQRRDGLYAGFERPIADTEDECLKQIPRKQRAVVRKALKSDLKYRVGHDVTTFHRLLAETYRNHGTPVFPRRYLETLVNTFGEDCDILTITDGDKPISAVLSFYQGETVTPYYTGSVRSARDSGANDLMYWRLMRHALNRGCKVFDFGRSKMGTGPYAFKKNWGFEPRPVTNWYYLTAGGKLPNLSPSNPKFGLLIRLWQKMPVPLTIMASRLIVGDLV